MNEPQKNLPHLSVDGKLFPCHPAGEFGFLGDRIYCDLVSTGVHPPKKLLFRKYHWLQGKNEGNCDLEIDKIPDTAQLGLRPLAVKNCQYAIPSADKKFKREEHPFLQQDISGLITLRAAILKVVDEGSPRKVWHLFYSACKALNGFGKTIGGQRLVPLQCPNGLAVDVKTGQVVMLDAEVRIPPSAILSAAHEAAFVKWFGSAGQARNAQANQASGLHSKALLLFFREVLGYLQKKEGAAGGIAKQLSVQLNGLATAGSLQELELKAEAIAEDWSLSSDEMPVASPAIDTFTSTSIPAARPSLRQEKKTSWLGWFLGSFLINVLLALLVFLFGGMLLLGLTDKKPSPDGKLPPGDEGSYTPSAVEDSSLQFSSYCVVFPTRGTSSEKVFNSVKQLYPDKILVPKQGESERSLFLKERLDLAAKSFKDADKVRKLIAKLNGDHSVRFDGFSSDAEDSGLRSIIASGGLYRVGTSGEKVQYGSLLRANSVERILKLATLDNQPEPRVLLDSLKEAAHEYASIKDAVTIIGDRPAFILRVEPTAKAHEAVRMQLLNRAGTPVFVPRPVFELFDAVDPAGGTGGGIARYSLKLDTKCIWRHVSSKDRKETDYPANETNEDMKWKDYAANREIVWTTLPVLRESGRTDNLASFDIAIPVNDDKVVVFRDQSILVGETKEQVRKQARTYLDRRLGLNDVAIEGAIIIRSQEKYFTGAFVYNFLAEEAMKAHGDLEIMSRAKFDTAREKDDQVLAK